MEDIANSCPEARHACSFQTLLVDRSQCNGNGVVINHRRPFDVKCALVLEIYHVAEHDVVKARFDSRVVKPWLVKKLLERLEFAICQIDSATPQQTISDLHSMTSQDLDQIWEWNSTVPSEAESCITDIIRQRSLEQPDSPAIHAWDGEISYGELNRLTSILAYLLVERGVGPEVFVPLCFEKSKWTTVALLGVLKAGGAFILLDPQLPEFRLRAIVDQVKPTLALSSPSQLELTKRLIPKTMEVDSSLFLHNKEIDFHPTIDLSSAAYAIFTSGSTGTPKGAIITNGNVASVSQQALPLNLTKESRVYDFVSYSFGLSLINVLPTLAVGGCVCVPSEQDRKSHLASSLTSLKATHVWLTPSIAETLSPEQVPTLKMMGFGGEALRVKDVLPWWERIEVRNGYGASECSSLISVKFNPSDPENACQIGPGVGITPWVVDPDDHNKLVPVGCVGELLIEGPHVSRGYLDDPEKTAAFFIENPEFLTRGSSKRPGRRARIYKTGDLVQYDEHGNLTCLGRKDVQVKIRGQRVELGEVEFQIKEVFPEARQLAAEVIVPQGGVEVGSTQATLLSVPQDAEKVLLDRLPSYMQRIQAIWATILNLDPQKIGLDDNFFKLGGNSVSAVKIVGEARKTGIQILVKDIFDHPELCALSSKALQGESLEAKTVAPFALLDQNTDISALRLDVSSQCRVDTSDIQDIYPCSPLQEGLFALAVTRPGDYVMQLAVDLSHDVDVNRFREAWLEVVRNTAVLRSRAIQQDGLGLLQVVLNEGIEWTVTSDLSRYLQADRKRVMQLGEPLTRYAIIQNDAGVSQSFVWTVHHAIYDGWMIPLIVDLVNRAYHGGEPEQGPQFQTFIHYVQSRDRAEMEAYWKQALEGSVSTPFPALPPSADEPSPNGVVEQQISSGTIHSEFTESTILRAAWALVAGRMTNSDDVVFGVTVSGRSTPVPGIDRMTGPAIATVPLRTRFSGTQTALDYLKNVQQQATDMIPYEQMGLQHIAKLSPEARQATKFQTLLLVQPQENTTIRNEIGEWRFGDDQEQWFNTYALTLEVYLDQNDPGKKIVKAFFNSTAIESEVVQRLLGRLEHVIHQLERARLGQLLDEIEVLTPTDLEEIWGWNHNLPLPIECCAHTMVEKRARLQPSAPAICAWDGELTYDMLNQLSERLAVHLHVDLGIGPGALVPLCFEKSMWMAVTMLAVLKAGGAECTPTTIFNVDIPRIENATQIGGSLTFVGRKDSQVKIRGQRVELSEVEHWVRTCKAGGAKQVVAEVLVPERSNSGPIIAAFCQIDGNDDTRSESHFGATLLSISKDVGDKLASSLPSYMIPSIFFSIPELPMTPTGKLDRKRLRLIGESFSFQEITKWNTAESGPKRQPTSELESHMQRIWAQVLSVDVETIGLDDSFFQLGGDSLAAMRVAAQARKIGIELAAADIFEHRQLSLVAGKCNFSAEVVPKGIPKTQCVGPVPQSFAQERLYFLEQLHPNLTWYHMLYSIRLQGNLRIDALGTALLALERRHETLRTTFSSANGINLQSVKPFEQHNFEVIDVSPNKEDEFRERLKKRQMTPFKLETEPGWRVCIFKLSPNQHVLSIVMHHIIADGWSIDILRTEIAAFYAAALHGKDPLSQVDPLPIQYRDYSVWQREDSQQVSQHQRQLDYWVTQLQTSRPAEMLYDKPRPDTLSGEAGVEHIRIEGSLYSALTRFCSERHVTPFISLLAAFRATHFRLTDQRDVTIGCPNANRDRWEQRDVLGFFVNMQCFRIKIQDHSFEDLVSQVQQVATASMANQDVPFENVVAKLGKDRELSRNPLVQMIFVVHSQLNLNRFTLEGLEAETIPAPPASRFDLEFHLYQEDEAFSGGIVYSTDLYNAETISNLLSIFKHMLEECLSDPDMAIHSIPLLTKADRIALDDRDLVKIHQTEYPRDSDVVSVFRRQALANPGRVAVKDPELKLTYAQLDQKSDLLAQWLSQRSLAEESLVGVFASRSCHTIIAILGILKARLAYLPFDIKIPPGRMQAILESVPSCKLVLCGVDVPAIDGINNVELIPITEALAPHHQSHEIIAQHPSPSSLAYVMFTSGSTGQPKGVMIEHRSILRLAKENSLVAQVPEHGIIGHISNIAFDASTWEIYTTLLNGSTLICINTDTLLDYTAVSRVFSQEAIQAIFITPALLKQYLSQCPHIVRRLRVLMVGGDRLDPDDIHTAQNYMKNGKIINGYGPTENTTFSTTYCIHDGESFTNGVPIGQAFDNSGAYVMDHLQRLVPMGVIGELVVTGDGLARGYTDPQRNADRFITITVDGKSVRAYRTGDYVRHRLSDGKLEFYGRIDGQTKIRGQRIEVGEIEHCLRRHTSVHDAVAVIQENPGHETHIASFVTVRVDEGGSGDKIVESTGDIVESKHVGVWEDRFNDETYAPMNDIQSESLGRDFVGWTSMYDGTEIDKGEMNEWLDETMDALLNGRAPSDVLEIGTGSGMILFNLGKGLRSYVGLDPSQRAVDFVANASRSIPGLAGKVRMFKATAAELRQLKGPISPNLVVINSVAQYFPSQEYLFKVVEDVLRLGSVETIFFGDMRSHALYKEFLASRALFMLGHDAHADDVKRMMAKMEEIELEFLVEPAFFTAMKERLPELIEHVEILPKRMKATNELSCYRYAAVIHAKPRGKHTSQLIHKIPNDNWRDFMAMNLDQTSLTELLKRQPCQEIVAVGNIPYSKTVFERYLVDSVSGDKKSKVDGADWLQDPENWKRVMFRFPTDHTGRRLQAMSSKPLKQQMSETIQRELRDLLQAHLPSYMVPRLITILDEMPINENGKVDRKALSNRRQMDTFRGPVRQPTTESERQIRAIWAEVLNVDLASIGVDDSFFQLGGNSIAAMKVVVEAREVGLQMVVADIFRYPRLCQLAERAAALEDADGSLAYMPQVKKDGLVEQSFSQQQLWFLEQLYPGLTWYLMPRALRIRGPLRLDSLKAALFAIETRHETLRTTFATTDDNVSIQEVHPMKSKDLRIVDIQPGEEGSLEKVLETDHNTPFDLTKEPGWRVTVFRLSREEHILSVVMHHIISDGWSVDVLCKELAACYSASVRGHDPLSQLNPLPIQYKDYSVWQRRRQQENKGKQLEYWVKQLETSRPAELLCDKIRPASLSGRASTERFKIEGRLYDRLQSLCAQYDATPYIILLTVFRLTHYYLTGQIDATIGTPFANRDQYEVKDLIGFFVNMQCFRIVIEDDDTFEGLIRQVRSVVTGGLENKDVPFMSIISELQKPRDLSRHPLVQLLFAVHSQLDLGILELEGVDIEILEGETTSMCDIEFHIYQEQHGLRGEVVYSTDLFVRESISNMISVFQNILEQGLRNPETPLTAMPYLTGEDYSKLEEMGLVEPRHTTYPRESSITDIFKSQVAECSSKVAVRDSTAELTYSQLDTLSDKLAAWLSTHSLESESLVGVFASRSCQTIVAFLGILKAGLAYVPFDVNTPKGRVESILSSIPGHTIVLVGENTRPPSIQLQNVKFAAITDVLNGHLQSNNNTSTKSKPRRHAPSATSLAYVMFTSGSTGKPKGVMVPHRGIVRLVKQSNMAKYLPPTGPNMAHLTNTAFDVSSWEIYGALLNGGTIVCIDHMTLLEQERLSDLFTSNGIQSAIFTPALLKQTLLQSPSAISILDSLFVAGERADGEDLYTAQKLMRQNSSGAKVINAYGPTENSVISTLYCLAEDEAFPNGVPIGVSISNSGAYVLDSQQRLVPLGVVGELVVTGDGLARGYTDPERNVDRFVKITINGIEMEAYRTGDYVRARPTDGLLEYFGRIDGQVKIRGYRVELGEIEHTLRDHDLVNEAVVVLQQGADGEIRLVGFITVSPKATKGLDENPGTNVEQNIEEKLSSRLRANLPPYMVPQSITVLERLPINDNGKVDRQALMDTSVIPSGKGKIDLRSPISEIEKHLQGIWARVLQRDEKAIGLDDSFFQLGGNSITAMKVVAEARKIGIRLAVADIFLHETLEDLATCKQDADNNTTTTKESVPGNLIDSRVKVELLEEAETVESGLHARNIADVLPLTSFQEKCVVEGISSGQFCNYFYLDLGDHLDIDRFERSCQTAIEKLPILRACFLNLMGSFWRVTLRTLDRPLRVVEIEEDLEASFTSFCLQDIPSCSHTQPALALVLLRHKSQGLRLVIRMSHGQYDGLCVPLIVEALFAQYQNKPIAEGPSFSKFLSYSSARRQQSSQYWKKLLEGSDLTTLNHVQPNLLAPCLRDARPRGIQVSADTKPLQLSGKTTYSSIASAAWALLLSCITGNKDVVYGHLISGRNSTIDSIEQMIGTFVNIIPVRVKLPTASTSKDLLRYVQDQFIGLGEADSLGFKDIMRNCTNWKDSKDFDFVIQHQNVDENPSFQVAGVETELQYFLNPNRLPPWKVFMVSYPQGGKLHVKLFTDDHIMNRETAQILVDKVVMIIEKLAADANMRLGSYMTEIQSGLRA
ncbi:acetyl-CoA synthetase-like protein [Daldinia vernicosa]|uniref:acetyl-CoA synthetase-like protein n=1 Tax=Daldinia vernicosa TaxID=114800 RepID=UPI00200803EF|nr:acetyl-CoA synthetase-like protein [Daldinia vernicosa]KAI0854078.1 acetyl-CoA synthetase-like protein [Daldinia vernicosa]